MKRNLEDTADLVGKTGIVQRGKHAEQRVTVARLVGSSKLIVTLADNASNQEEFTIDRANIEFDGSSSDSILAISTSEPIARYLRSDSGTLEFQMKIHESEFCCVVCYEPLVGKVFQCMLGAHNICQNCRDSIRSSGKDVCPMDRTSGGFIPNPRLEKEIAVLTQPCQFNSCSAKVFPWSQEQHSKLCDFAPFQCPLCHLTVADSDDEATSEFNFFERHLQSGQCWSAFHPVQVRNHQASQSSIQLPPKTSCYFAADPLNFILFRLLAGSEPSVYMLIAINLNRSPVSVARRFTVSCTYAAAAPKDISSKTSASVPSTPSRTIRVSEISCTSVSAALSNTIIDGSVTPPRASPPRSFSVPVTPIRISVSVTARPVVERAVEPPPSALVLSSSMDLANTVPQSTVRMSLSSWMRNGSTAFVPVSYFAMPFPNATLSVSFE